MAKIEPAPTIGEAITTLIECALMISTFRERLDKSGYPFPEPHGVKSLMARIDALTDPDTGLDRALITGRII